VFIAISSEAIDYDYLEKYFSKYAESCELLWCNYLRVLMGWSTKRGVWMHVILLELGGVTSSQEVEKKRVITIY